MKNLLLIIFLFTTTGSFAQSKVVEDSISVSGNCVMCKRRIEAALDLPGIKAADWNVKTKKLFIAYKSEKISALEIHKAVAAIGHDTDKVKAKDEVYAELAFCCLYRDHDPHGPGHEEKEGHDDGHED